MERENLNQEILEFSFGESKHFFQNPRWKTFFMKEKMSTRKCWGFPLVFKNLKINPCQLWKNLNQKMLKIPFDVQMT